MNSLPLSFGIGYKGIAQGTTLDSELQTTLTLVAACSLTGANKQAYAQTLTIPPASTTTLDLTTGLTNVLGEPIAGAPFTQVYGCIVYHVPTSESTSVRAFAAGANAFQGFLSAGASEAIPKGGFVGSGIVETTTGMTVDGTHKNLALANLDGANVATVRVGVFGITS